MDLDLKSVRLFVRVASLGAIGKAGSEIGISATAATQRIRALEESVGVQLLHRTTRNVSLSVDGEIFLEHAKQISASVDSAFADLLFEPNAVKGELRVASSASFGRRHLAPYAAEFLEKYPNVSLQLEMSDSIVDVVEHGLDMAIRLGELAPSSLKALKLGESPRIVVASPRYIERHGQPQTIYDLKTHNCLARADVRTWRFRTPNNTSQDVRINGNFATNLAEGVTEAALTGLGIARKCKWEIEGLLENGDLIELLQDYTILPEWNIFAVRAPSKQPPPRVRVFTEFLKVKFRKIPSLRSAR